jgi:hypothetical protein
MFRKLIFLYFIFSNYLIFAQQNKDELDMNKFAEMAGLVVFFIVLILLGIILIFSRVKFEEEPPKRAAVAAKKSTAGASAVAIDDRAFKIIFISTIALIIIYFIKLVLLL